jgi:arsenate reductase
MADRTCNVLFLCTGNSARSIMAEVMLNHLGKGRFRAHSAGSHPSGKVNPFAIEAMQAMGLATNGLRSKGWDEFAAAGAPPVDFIFTVCDNAAGEACPVWPGKPVTRALGRGRSAAVEGSDAQKRAAFHEAATVLRRRIDLFLALPLEKIEAHSLRAKLREIGTK